jgi:hypothetical protein
MNFDKRHTHFMEGTETVIAPPAPVVDAPSSGIVITRQGGVDVPRSDAAAPQTTPIVDTAPTPTPVVPPVDNAPVISPPVAPDEEEIEFFPYAAERTGGLIKSPDDVFDLHQKYTELEKKYAEKPKIEFASPEAEFVYNYANKFPGQEVAAINGFYQVMALGDVSKLSDKEIQFEAFALEHKDLTRDKAREYFEAKYDRSYGNDVLTEDKVAQYDHMLQTKKARETLKKLQDEFSQAKPPSQPAGQQPQGVSDEVRAQIQAEAQESLRTFGGMEYQMFDNDPDSVVEIRMEDSEKQQIQNWTSDPQTFLNDLTKLASDERGNFSMPKLTQIMFEIMNRDKIRIQTWTTATNYGKLQHIKELKNSTPPKGPDAPVPTIQAPQSFAEAMINAVKGKK